MSVAPKHGAVESICMCTAGGWTNWTENNSKKAVRETIIKSSYPPRPPVRSALYQPRFRGRPRGARFSWLYAAHHTVVKQTPARSVPIEIQRAYLTRKLSAFASVSSMPPSVFSIFALNTSAACSASAAIAGLPLSGAGTALASLVAIWGVSPGMLPSMSWSFYSGSSGTVWACTPSSSSSPVPTVELPRYTCHSMVHGVRLAAPSSAGGGGAICFSSADRCEAVSSFDWHTATACAAVAVAQAGTVVLE